MLRFAVALCLSWGHLSRIELSEYRLVFMGVAAVNFIIMQFGRGNAARNRPLLR